MAGQRTLHIHTRGRGCTELTGEVDAFVRESGIRNGICHLFVLHTSASLMLCENADPAVLRDMETFISGLVPDGDPRFCHVTEGADDMAAHARSVLTGVDLSIPVSNGRCRLGTWQGIYLWEHRAQGHDRKVVMTVYGAA